MRVNRLRATLKAGGVALGTLIWETRGRGVVHTLAAAGMDFVMICTEEAVENAEEILIPGIDVALVGHQDLAQSLGVPGQYSHPKVREANARVNALCRQRGIALTAGVNNPEGMKAAVESGAQF